MLSNVCKNNCSFLSRLNRGEKIRCAYTFVKNVSSAAYCTRFHTAVNLNTTNSFMYESGQWSQNSLFRQFRWLVKGGDRLWNCEDSYYLFQILQWVSSSICSVCTASGKRTKSVFALSSERGRERETRNYIFLSLLPVSVLMAEAAAKKGLSWSGKCGDEEKREILTQQIRTFRGWLIVSKLMPCSQSPCEGG